MVKNLPVVQETQVQSSGQECPLEKEMAVHSSILAWKIPWTEEPAGLHIVYGVAKSWTRLSDCFLFFFFLIEALRLSQGPVTPWQNRVCPGVWDMGSRSRRGRTPENPGGFADMTTQWAETSMAGGKCQGAPRARRPPSPSSLDPVLGAHPPVGQECVGLDHSVRYLTGPIWALSRQTAGGWEHRMPALRGGGGGTSAKNVPFQPPLTASFQKTVGSCLTSGDFTVLSTSLLGNEQLCLGCVR